MLQVLAGADLYLQGLIAPTEGWGHFQKGELHSVAIPQNPAPFAVGTVEVDSADLARTGLKGKGLHLLHHFPDQLWALGDKTTPNSAFTPTRVFPLVPYLPRPAIPALPSSAEIACRSVSRSGPMEWCHGDQPAKPTCSVPFPIFISTKSMINYRSSFLPFFINTISTILHSTVFLPFFIRTISITSIPLPSVLLFCTSISPR